MWKEYQKRLRNLPNGTLLCAHAYVFYRVDFEMCSRVVVCGVEATYECHREAH